jgi:hypothetical protein
MSNNPAANARTLSEASDGQTPFSGLHREVGLAAVANELNLQLNTLEPDVAAAVERGAAALRPCQTKSGPMHHGMRSARQVGIPSEDQAMTVPHSVSAAERLCL